MEDNPFYPYHKDISNNTLRGAELIPYKLLMYMLDMPDSAGHQPFESNENPRARFIRYLYHDTPNPLAQPLPTPQQKLSLVFDADHPDINTDELKAKHPKGYRIFSQHIIGQSGLDANTVVKCYIRNLFETKPFQTIIGITFEVWCNVNLIANTRTTAYDRCFAIEQCLHEALNGVNIAGIGTITFNRGENVYNGSEGVYDSSLNAGRIVTCSVVWSEGGGNTVLDYKGF